VRCRRDQADSITSRQEKTSAKPQSVKRSRRPDIPRRPIEHGGLVGLCALGAAGFLYLQGYNPGFEVPQWAMLLVAFFALPAGAAGGFVASDSPGAFI
jgi:hypothetical protein